MKTCDFSICASNPRARRVEAEAAAIMALQLANSKKSYLCPRIPDELEIDAMPPFPFGPLLAPKSRSNQSSRNHSRSSSMISFNEKPNSFFTSLFANMVEGKSKFSHSRSASDVGKLGLNKLAVSDSHNALEEVHNRPSSPTDSDLSSMDSLNSLCKASLIDYDNSQFGLSKLNLSLVQIAIETCTLVDMNGQPDFNFLLSTIRSVFSSVSTLSRSFTIGDEIFNTIDLNVKDISSAYEMILELKNEDLIEEICDSSEIALKKICSRIKVQPNGSPSLFRAMIIIMMVRIC